MDKAIAWMEKYILPGATKLGNQRHLLAIRDGFLALIGLTMISSLCTLVIAFPNEAYKEWLNSSDIGLSIISIASDISWGAFTFYALLIAFAVGNSLWKRYGKDGCEGGLVATASFLIVSAKTVTITPEGGEAIFQSGLAPSQFGAGALFTSLIVSLLAVELLRVLANSKRLTIKLPDMVPPAVSKSFATLFPIMIAITVVGIINFIILKISNGLILNDIIVKVLQAPLKNISDTLGVAILYPLLIGLFWSLGLHGSSIVNAVAEPILLSLGTENMEFAQLIGTSAEVSSEVYNTLTVPFFNSFVWLGGAGATMGLLIATFVTGKKVRERFKIVSGIGMAPGVFNINEPVIFGLPIVLNPILMVPFILIPVVLSVFSYFMVSSGIVPPSIVVSMPWTTPVGFSGFLSTGSLAGAALSVFNLFLSIVLYMPFVKIAVALEEKQFTSEIKQ